jgi:hypothetical protein
LVTPIEDIVYPHPYGSPEDWPGRLVKVITMTENQVGNSIVLGNTMWSNAGFEGAYQDLSFVAGKIRKIPNIPQLSNLQTEIWSRFQPFKK